MGSLRWNFIRCKRRSTGPSESCRRFGPLPADGVPAKHGGNGEEKAEREVNGQRERDGFGVAGDKQIFQWATTPRQRPQKNPHGGMC